MVKKTEELLIVATHCSTQAVKNSLLAQKPWHNTNVDKLIVLQYLANYLIASHAITVTNVSNLYLGPTAYVSLSPP